PTASACLATAACGPQRSLLRNHDGGRNRVELEHLADEIAQRGDERRGVHRLARDHVLRRLRGEPYLLGTAEQVRLAAQAAQDMVTGKPVETAALVTSLRDFIREVLELDAIPASVVIPKQGPLRPASGGGKAGGGGGRDGGSRGGGGGGGAGAGGLGAGLGLGVAGSHAGDASQEPGDDGATR